MYKVKEPVYSHHVPSPHFSPIYKSLSHKPSAFKTVHSHRPFSAYHQPSYQKPTTKAIEYHDNASYKFSYGVVDGYAKLNYGENEERNGDVTTGEYRVLLPDCRTQIVKYHTDNKYSGNIMEVTYEGEPC